jgi:hypothetical protein
MVKFELLSSEAVVSVDSREECYFEDKVIVVGDAILSMLENCNDEHQNWFKQGVRCKVMTPNQSGWIKGKVRFALEFCPDEPVNNREDNDQKP